MKVGERRYWPLIAIALVACLILLAYGGLSRTFYQQDEWQQLGLILGGRLTTNPFDEYSIWQLLLGQGRLLSGYLYYFILTKFPYNVTPFIIFGLIFHILNTGLVYLLARRLTDRLWLAVVAAVFFGLNAVAYEAIAWVAAIGTLPATTLVLLSIFAYLEFIKTDRRSWFWTSFGLMLISLTFKELGIFLVVLLPLLYLLEKKRSLRATITANWTLLAYGLAVILFRVSQLFSANEAIGTLVTGSAGFKERVIVHLILYPLTGLFQSIFPTSLTYPLAKKLSLIQYPYLKDQATSDLVAYTVVADLISLVGSIALLGLLFYLVKNAAAATRRTLLFSLALLLLSFLPYIVIDRGGSYLDSRYYYVAAVGAGLIVGLIVDWAISRRLWIKLAALIAVGMLLLANFTTIRTNISNQQSVAAERRLILEAIKQSLPELPAKAIFYIAGNRDYHVTDHKVPFQQGVGYTLLVWYSLPQPPLPQALNDKFLWEIASQGYVQESGRGFGYFSRLDTLEQALRDNNLTNKAVYGYYWDSQKQKLSDITAQTRQHLESKKL